MIEILKRGPRKLFETFRVEAQEPSTHLNIPRTMIVHLIIKMLQSAFKTVLLVLLNLH